MLSEGDEEEKKGSGTLFLAEAASRIVFILFIYSGGAVRLNTPPCLCGSGEVLSGNGGEGIEGNAGGAYVSELGGLSLSFYW